MTYTGIHADSVYIIFRASLKASSRIFISFLGRTHSPSPEGLGYFMSSHSQTPAQQMYVWNTGQTPRVTPSFIFPLRSDWMSFQYWLRQSLDSLCLCCSISSFDLLSYTHSLALTLGILPDELSSWVWLLSEA